MIPTTILISAALLSSGKSNKDDIRILANLGIMYPIYPWLQA
jgi:hypothetical protein